MRFQLLLFGAALARLSAQDHGSITGNPFSTPEDRQAGMKLFRSACAACHGLKGGGGGNGPSLITGTFKRGGSDQALFRTITQGVPDTPMVAFPLDGREVWRLVTYIRSLNIGHEAEQAKGNAAKGEQVFAAHGCARCHTTGGAGGFTGPDLSEIGSRRSLTQTRKLRARSECRRLAGLLVAAGADEVGQDHHGNPHERGHGLVSDSGGRRGGCVRSGKRIWPVTKSCTRRRCLRSRASCSRAKWKTWWPTWPACARRRHSE